MRTIETKIYTFNELSDEAKQKAIEKYYYTNVEYHDWSEWIREDFISQTKDFEVDNVLFSGFHSQGDGAMFEYSSISQELFNEAINSLNIPNYKKSAMIKGGYVNAKGNQLGHYFHEKSCNHIFDFETNNCDHDNIGDLFYDNSIELESFVTNSYEDIAKELYRSLEKSYEYLTSEESITETLVENEYEFTEEGNIF